MIYASFVDSLVGSRVVIDRYKQRFYDKYDLIGRSGIVKRASKDMVGVLVDGVENPSSSYSLFWFRVSEVHKVSEKEKINMKSLKGFNKVAIIEIGCTDNLYALYEDGTDYNVGDNVLVSGKHNNVVSIKDIKDYKPELNVNIISEVICKVDLSAYTKRVEDRKRAEELISQMDKKIKEMDEVLKYEMYAKSNPELASMLEEFKGLSVC